MAAVQAQLANLTGSISDLTGSSQELIMTSVNEGLDAHEGKVIRIVSLSQDGSILSLGDGSHMQILGEDALQVGGEIKVKIKPFLSLERFSSTSVCLHALKYCFHARLQVQMYLEIIDVVQFVSLISFYLSVNAVTVYKYVF